MKKIQNSARIFFAFAHEILPLKANQFARFSCVADSEIPGFACADFRESALPQHIRRDTIPPMQEPPETDIAGADDPHDDAFAAMQEPPETDIAGADDPHDDAFADAGPDPEFTNEAEWLKVGSVRKSQPLVFSQAVDLNAPVAESRFLVDWVDQHREARYPADPSYPGGSSIDAALDAPKACRLELPYPASRCGIWVITCRVCGYSIALATTGRADDPRSVRVACRQH